MANWNCKSCGKWIAHGPNGSPEQFTFDATGLCEACNGRINKTTAQITGEGLTNVVATGLTAGLVASLGVGSSAIRRYSKNPERDENIFGVLIISFLLFIFIAPFLWLFHIDIWELLKNFIKSANFIFPVFIISFIQLLAMTIQSLKTKTWEFKKLKGTFLFLCSFTSWWFLYDMSGGDFTLNIEKIMLLLLIVIFIWQVGLQIKALTLFFNKK